MVVNNNMITTYYFESDDSRRFTISNYIDLDNVITKIMNKPNAATLIVRFTKLIASLLPLVWYVHKTKLDNSLDIAASNIRTASKGLTGSNLTDFIDKSNDIYKSTPGLSTFQQILNSILGGLAIGGIIYLCMDGDRLLYHIIRKSSSIIEKNDMIADKKISTLQELKSTLEDRESKIKEEQDKEYIRKAKRRIDEAIEYVNKNRQEVIKK